MDLDMGPGIALLSCPYTRPFSSSSVGTLHALLTALAYYRHHWYPILPPWPKAPRRRGERGERVELPSEEELQQRWDEVMDLLSEEDREHLEKEADGATLEEKFGMLQQVCAGLHLLFLNPYYCVRRLSRS